VRSEVHSRRDCDDILAEAETEHWVVNRLMLNRPRVYDAHQMVLRCEIQA
jgi:hypothetical protein